MREKKVGWVGSWHLAKYEENKFLNMELGDSNFESCILFASLNNLLVRIIF